MNYGNIAKALDFYQERGYVYIEDAPWHVTREASHVTKPPESLDILIDSFQHDIPSSVPFARPHLVASGEQSFIQMLLDGQPLKRAICITPCFRREPRVDMLHRYYFMKAELINAQDVDEGHLIHMIHDACSFFEEVGLSVRVVNTTPSRIHLPTYDIVEKGSRFELGSYGIRQAFNTSAGDLKWIYGTACAEPRLSTAIQKSLKHVGR